MAIRTIVPRAGLAGLAVLAAVSQAGAAGGPRQYLNRSDDWFRSPEAARIASNILSHQSAEGAWPKNVDTTAAPYRGDRARLKGTFDNRATTDELRFLARAFAATLARLRAELHPPAAGNTPPGRFRQCGFGRPARIQ